MRFTTENDPQLFYAEALQAKGILVSRTFNKHGLVVMPQVTPSDVPEEPIPLCVEYLDNDALQDAFIDAWVDVRDTEDQLDIVFKKIVYSEKRENTNLLGASIGLVTAYGVHQLAPASVKPMSYVMGSLALVSGGLAAYWWKLRSSELSNRQELLTSYDIALGNFALCFKETQKRGIAPVSLGQTPVMAV